MRLAELDRRLNQAHYILQAPQWGPVIISYRIDSIQTPRNLVQMHKLLNF